MGNLTNSQATTTVSEYDATKGTTINGALQILDDTIAGQIDITVTTADITLTGTSVAPQAQHLFLNASGVLTGNRAITVPVTATGAGKARLYIVKNGTTGAFTLTFKLAGGTGTTIGQGYSALCFFDGTDIVKLLETVSAGSGTAWASWTPTWTNLSVGNGTVVAKFIRIGNVVHARVSLVFGSTTSVSGDIQVSLPTAKATYAGTAGASPIGMAGLFDLSPGALYDGRVHMLSTTAGIRPADSSGTYLQSVVASSTVPFTWATGDEIGAVFSYEAA